MNEIRRDIEGAIQWRGNYFRTGGQDRERQCREREIMLFAENGEFLFQKLAFFKKKGLRRNWSVFLSLQTNVL